MLRATESQLRQRKTTAKSQHIVNQMYKRLLLVGTRWDKVNLLRIFEVYSTSLIKTRSRPQWKFQ